MIDHILEHGHITTEELKETYGYDHPPRAVQDVRDKGIPIETFSVVGRNGRTIAAYKFGDEEKARADKLTGRKNFPKAFKKELIDRYGSICAIHLDKLEERELQIDHRIPYQVAGDNVKEQRRSEDFMLLCGSANRAKSWSCEHCVNWLVEKSEDICRTCYWAYPENYQHVAMRPERRVDITWTENEVEVYDRLKERATQVMQELPEYVKDILAKHINEE